MSEWPTNCCHWVQGRHFKAHAPMLSAGQGRDAQDTRDGCDGVVAVRSCVSSITYTVLKPEASNRRNICAMDRGGWRKYYQHESSFRWTVDGSMHQDGEKEIDTEIGRERLDYANLLTSNLRIYPFFFFHQQISRPSTQARCVFASCIALVLRLGWRRRKNQTPTCGGGTLDAQWSMQHRCNLLAASGL